MVLAVVAGRRVWAVFLAQALDQAYAPDRVYALGQAYVRDRAYALGQVYARDRVYVLEQAAFYC